MDKSWKKSSPHLEGSHVMGWVIEDSISDRHGNEIRKTVEYITAHRSSQDKIVGEKSQDWCQKEKRHYKCSNEVNKTQMKVLKFLLE
jgi:hypothetical protein